MDNKLQHWPILFLFECNEKIFLIFFLMNWCDIPFWKLSVGWWVSFLLFYIFIYLLLSIHPALRCNINLDKIKKIRSYISSSASLPFFPYGITIIYYLKLNHWNFIINHLYLIDYLLFENEAIAIQFICTITDWNINSSKSLLKPFQKTNLRIFETSS